jgi:hypothetical protein
MAATVIAISLGATFFGALTYIGNAPNLLVKTIAEHTRVSTLSFIGYNLGICASNPGSDIRDALYLVRLPIMQASSRLSVNAFLTPFRSTLTNVPAKFSSSLDQFCERINRYRDHCYSKCEWALLSIL